DWSSDVCSSDLALKLPGLLQGALQAGRRDLQAVGAGNGIDPVQLVAEKFAHPLAIVQGDAAVPVDAHPENATTLLGHVGNIHQLDTTCVGDGLRQCLHLGFNLIPLHSRASPPSLRPTAL